MIKMSFTLGRVFNSSSKCFISDRIFSFTTITSLHSLDHDARINNNPNQIPCRKILKPVLVHQLRYYSVNFNDSLYNLVTTNEATKFVTDLLIRAHDLSGLHWCGTLIAAPLVFKLLYGIPCAIYQHKLIAKTELISIQSKPLVDNLKHELMIEGRQKRWPAEKMQKNFKRETRKLMKKIMIENNVHPFKLVILSLIQIPPWVLITMSVSKLAEDVSSGTIDSVAAAFQFPVGGPFWCPDLSSRDPTFILPITLFLVTLTTFEVNWLLKTQKDAPLFRIVNNLFRIFACLVFLVALQVSSGLSLFWTSNAVFGLIQNLLLFSPRVRRMLRIPKTPSELEKPYSHLADEIKKKWSRLFSKK